jgi:hypothetical protein
MGKTLISFRLILYIEPGIPYIHLKRTITPNITKYGDIIMRLGWTEWGISGKISDPR